MPSSLDMSLDDIIRKNSRSEAHNRHFRGGRTAVVSRSGPGPDRRFQNRDPIRTRPYPVVPARGTAEVIYSSQANALAAIRRYNDMNLDGKPMKIELVGESVFANNACIRELVCVHRNDARGIGARGTGGGREFARVYGNDARGIGVRGTGGGGHGGRESTIVHKPGNQNRPGKKLTAQDLDAELEKYHFKAKRIK
ncbi:hypothetical protein LWI29_020219 [Acer saccharum]|uniref:Chromatin target of PRMT1 protein C-terminal domain-containing protein n=1 Tax=Acer saccharum TaxID=4024 RepID=A0AA39VNJ3_ACESA|nr:hypothetical protein LWI29_020219 [Acer saccharum]